MLLELDAHNKQVNDTVNTLKNCYNDAYTNMMHNNHILCYLVFPYSWPNIFVTHIAWQFLLNVNVAGTSSVETVLLLKITVDIKYNLVYSICRISCFKQNYTQKLNNSQNFNLLQISNYTIVF